MPPDEPVSGYYPPRARWWSPLLLQFFSIRRGLRLDGIHLPGGLTTEDFLLSLVVPGYSLCVLGRPALGRIFQGAYCVSVIVFVVLLGFPMANFAYGIMLGVHATGLVFVQTAWLREICGFALRLVVAILTLIVLWRMIYAPVIGFVERHWCMPLRVHGRVVVVNPTALPRVAKGEWVMYSLTGGRAGDAHDGGAIWVRDGYGWGPVLAAGGEHVSFSTNGFTIDGAVRPLLSNMPTSGELVVPEKHWFVWPEFAMAGRGGVNPHAVSGLMLQLGTVSESQIIGRPYNRWFFRRQTF